MSRERPHKFDVIVGIPSHNEERTIAHVTRQIDLGLQKSFPTNTCLIVNVDSESTDNTRAAFEHISTACPKRHINGGSSPRGKGANLFALFRLATRLNARFIASIDADITSVTPEWTQKLLEPLVMREHDFSIPFYTRDRFEATTTNQFAYPLVYGVLHVDVRQPIGGDFAVSRKFCKYLLRQQVDTTVLRFGIDIFITCHALAGGFSVEEVPLGRKIHKSGFAKMEKAFEQVATVALQTLRVLLCEPPRPTLFQKAAGEVQSGIDASSTPRPPDAVANLLERMKTQFLTNRERYRANLGPWSDVVVKHIREPRLAMSQEVWTAIMAHCVSRALYAPIDKAGIAELVEALTPVFVARVVAFWKQVQDLAPGEVESIVREQSELFARKLARAE